MVHQHRPNCSFMLSHPATMLAQTQIYTRCSSLLNSFEFERSKKQLMQLRNKKIQANTHTIDVRVCMYTNQNTMKNSQQKLCHFTCLHIHGVLYSIPLIVVSFRFIQVCRRILLVPRFVISSRYTEVVAFVAARTELFVLSTQALTSFTNSWL